MDITLTGRVETLRKTINDMAYATSALRSDQAIESESITSGLMSPGNGRKGRRFPIEESEAMESETATAENDGESTGNDMDANEVDDTDENDVDESDTDENDVPAEEEDVGGRIEVLNLYSTRESDEGRAWVFTAIVPPQVKLQQHQARKGEKTTDPTRTFAIVHKHRVEGKVRGVSIQVQNQILKERLSVVFEGYLELDPEAPLFEFNAGFEPFVHRWDRLIASEKAEKDKDGKELLKLLIGLLSEELTTSFRAFQDFKTTGYIDFDHILLAYKPGDIVVRSKDDILSAGKLRKASKIETIAGEILLLKVAILDWDGEKRGWRKKKWQMPPYEGIRRLSDFSVFPLNTHSESKQIRIHLTERGKMFHSLCGCHMRIFQGRAKVSARQRLFDYGSDDTIYLSERVILDAKAYHQFHSPKPSLAPLNAKDDNVLTALSNPQGQNLSIVEKRDSPTIPPLDESDLILAVPKVKGFALENKSWHKFNIDGLRPISWNHGILENLVLETEEKSLLLALVSQHGVSDHVFDDFIQGKGKGMILLLGGPPGVGKTLTAEAVAENLQRPLYRIRAGDLGVEAGKVESSLKKALEHCAYWNAVLLIDEADIFLEQRTSDNIQRNELVSIFLVLLEYYRGVLFLTTNRIDSIDAAFESRIDIILSYRDLTSSARREIWSNFVKRLPSKDVNLEPDDLTTLSQWNLNGRQVKSAIKTARMLALQENTRLNIKHLDTVVRIRMRGTRLLKPGDDGTTGAEIRHSPADGILRWCLAWLPVRILATISYLFDRIQTRG
ncbi:hypothetical protein KVR01_011272 [Diaporthe batatas]|uniref:uncharacterized protein n=1 Tax=Diaporthe batatas TaxID=748121 RepID=UPI001D03D60B|nr:uncharacterized protein KVR01_011272 [Diaporthe batatas]KAG8158829.1 hypothetical protein KVR01_011272 [Diaporthe batatas]